MKAAVHMKIIAAAVLLLSGCSFFDNGRQVTREAVFQYIQVRDFEQGRLQFEGTLKDKTYSYVYDMGEEVLYRRKGSVKTEEVVYAKNNLGHNGNVTVEMSDGKSRLIWKQADGERKELAQVNKDNGLSVSIAPNQAFLMYWSANNEVSRLHLYDLGQQRRTFSLDTSGRLGAKDVLWSPDSLYVLIKRKHIYRVPDGEEVLQLNKGWGFWTAAPNELLALHQERKEPRLVKREKKRYGHRIVKYNLQTGEKEELFRIAENAVKSGAELSNPFILGEIVIDSSGRYFAFTTGRVAGGDIYYEKVHIMDRQGGFHHIENEQNLRPPMLDHLSFSSDSQYFAYTASGLLKVLHIPTQKSKVFDVYTHLKDEDRPFLIYGKENVWVLGNREVRSLSSELEEKIVYESPDELVHFFVSEDEEKLLVVERGRNTYRLKLVALTGKEGEGATHGPYGTVDEGMSF